MIVVNDIKGLKQSIKQFLSVNNKSIINLYAIVDDKLFFLNKADDDNINKDLLEEFTKDIFDKLDGIDYLETISNSDDCNRTLYLYDLKTNPPEFNFMEKVKQNENEMKNFALKDHKFKDIDAIIIKIENINGKIILYKKNYPINAFSKDKFLIFEKNSRFKRVENDILRIDINFQAFLYNNKFYILDINNLYKIFKIDKIIKKEANKTIKTIESRELIENIQLLESEAEDLRLARKLIKIGRNGIISNDRITNKDIIDFTRKHSYFTTNKLKVNEMDTKFILDTKKSVNTFLELLNDQLLNSELSGKEYNSLNKKEIVV